MLLCISTPWTSLLSAPPRSSPSQTASRSLRPSTLQSSVREQENRPLIGRGRSRDLILSGISTDSHFSHLAWVNQPRKKGGLGGLDYPLVSDFNKNISRDYGVLIEEAGIALRGRFGDKSTSIFTFTCAGLFIIDPEGVVRQMSINDLPVGRSVDETLRLIKAFQFVEKHGEVRNTARWSLVRCSHVTSVLLGVPHELDRHLARHFSIE